MIVVLGAGLAGLSVSYHAGHERCVLLEKNGHAFGHIHSESASGFTWDEGPHVSFTNDDYVRELFARSVGRAFEEYPVRTVNHFRGAWIDHPAQSNLYQVPEPLRGECIRSFLAARATPPPQPADYRAWLDYAFGRVFAENFPERYTRKYWTVPAASLTTDWIGQRVFYPGIDDVLQGAKGPLPAQTHYIKKVRYPSRGGYQSFARTLAAGARIEFGATCEAIDLKERLVILQDGRRIPYDQLVNTLPLPEFVRRCRQATPQVLAAADALHCSQLVLVNITAPHPSRVDGNWFYLYDEELLSTRVHLLERLSPHNAPPGHTGVQVEVYAGPDRPWVASVGEIGARVAREMEQLGFVDSAAQAQVRSWLVPWANVIFDHERRAALQCVLAWLEAFGLARETDELEAMTDWKAAGDAAPVRASRLLLAGRFGQWKYFWSDDCVLRGRQLAASLSP